MAIDTITPAGESEERRVASAQAPAGGEAGCPSPGEPGGEPSLAEIADRPLLEILRIAAPSVATMTSYTVMQFIDGLMVSRIGPEPVYVAAQGNGGIAVWFLLSFALGASGVVNTFVSQNLGAGRPREGAGYLWSAAWLNLAWYAAVLLPAALIVGRVYALADHDSELLRLEVAYARISIYGGILILMARTLAHYFYGMHRPVVVFVAAMAGNVTNLFANGVLIFGEAGFPVAEGGAGVLAAYSSACSWVAGALGVPAMGVAGAAVATVLGAVVELAIPTAIFLSPKYAREFGTRAAWRLSWTKAKDLLRIGWPAGMMFTNEIACWTYLLTYLLRAGGEAAGEDPVVHNTAGWVALRYMHLSFMPAVGLSIAVSAVVGKCMGARRPDLAESRGWLSMRLGVAYMGLCALVFVLFREELIGLFVSEDTPADQRAELVRVGGTVMIAAAVFQLFDAMAIVMSGALRGAGDTVWPGVVTVVSSWLCIVGGGHLLIAVAPGLGSVGPWIAASAFIIVLGIAMTWRWAAGGWKALDLVRREG